MDYKVPETKSRRDEILVNLVRNIEFDAVGIEYGFYRDYKGFDKIEIKKPGNNRALKN